jgi:hypothetical protein
MAVEAIAQTIPWFRFIYHHGTAIAGISEIPTVNVS